MTVSAWPFVAVLVGPKLEDFRTVGPWQAHEKQVAIDWCCEWWVMMFGKEPDTIDIRGQYADDHKAMIYSKGHTHMITLTQLGNPYRDDVEVLPRGFGNR